MSSPRPVGTLAILATLVAVLGFGRGAQMPGAFARLVERDSVDEERKYAQAVSAIGDSAIHGLDFFPQRAALRVQMAFASGSRDAAGVPFAQLSTLGSNAATAIDGRAQRFAGVGVPPDLKALHSDLLKSLRAAADAADRLSAAAAACVTAAESVLRCQTPFTAASTRLSAAYHDYLAVRARIGEQVQDTHTELAGFAVAAK